MGLIALAGAVALVAHSGYAGGSTIGERGANALMNTIIVLVGLAGPAIAYRMYRAPARRIAAALVGFIAAAGLFASTRIFIESAEAVATPAVAAAPQPTTAAAPAPTATSAPTSSDEIELQRISAERAALYYIPTSEAEVAAARAAYLQADDAYRAACSERRDPKCDDLATDLSGKQNVLLAVVRNRSATQEADELDTKAAQLRAKINAPHPAIGLLAKLAQDPTGSVSHISTTSTSPTFRWQLIIGTLLGELAIAGSLLAWAVPARPSKATAIRQAIREVPTRTMRRTPADDSDLARFLHECIRPSRGESIEMRALYVRFLDWCDGQGLSASPPRKFSQAVVRQAQIEVGTDGAEVICRDVKLAPAHLLH